MGRNAVGLLPKEVSGVYFRLTEPYRKYGKVKLETEVWSKKRYWTVTFNGKYVFNFGRVDFGPRLGLKWFENQLDYYLRGQCACEYRDYLCQNFRYSGCERTKRVSLWVPYDPSGALDWLYESHERPHEAYALCETCSDCGDGSPLGNWNARLQPWQQLDDDAVCTGCSKLWIELDKHHECSIDAWAPEEEDKWYDPTNPG